MLENFQSFQRSVNFDLLQNMFIMTDCEECFVHYSAKTLIHFVYRYFPCCWGGVFDEHIFLFISGTKDGWPYLLLLNAVPAFVSLILLPFVPDSPRYLMLVRRKRIAAEKCK